MMGNILHTTNWEGNIKSLENLGKMVVTKLRCQSPKNEPILVVADRNGVSKSSKQTIIDSILTEDEKERHKSLLQIKDKECFIVGRALARVVAGKWHNHSPNLVEIKIGKNGKPRCTKGPEFNISHSGDMILLGFHSKGQIGVDIEQCLPQPEWKAVAQQVLSTSEIERISLHHQKMQQIEFIKAWCRMEARVKATGEGLSNTKAIAPKRELWEWDVQVKNGYVAAAALITQSNQEERE